MKRILEIIWIILLILTVFAYLLGYLKYINTFFISILLLSTFIKGQLIVDYFMGLKKTQLKYRIIPSLWLVITIILIAIVYYIPN
jgi:cytochrome c oxidase subunit IV